MSLLLPDSGLLFWMLLSFGVVFAVLAKYGFPVITRMVEERKAFIDRSLSEAHEANRQLSELRRQGEQLIAEANKEQGRILRCPEGARRGTPADSAGEGGGYPRHPPPGGRALSGHCRKGGAPRARPPRGTDGPHRPHDRRTPRNW